MRESWTGVQLGGPPRLAQLFKSRFDSARLRRGPLSPQRMDRKRPPLDGSWPAPPLPGNPGRVGWGHTWMPGTRPS